MCTIYRCRTSRSVQEPCLPLCENALRSPFELLPLVYAPKRWQRDLRLVEIARSKGNPRSAVCETGLCPFHQGARLQLEVGLSTTILGPKPACKSAQRRLLPADPLASTRSTFYGRRLDSPPMGIIQGSYLARR